ncbi:MAG: DUF4190 domain-containing protein [Rhodoglobus sp.]
MTSPVSLALRVPAPKNSYAPADAGVRQNTLSIVSLVASLMFMGFTAVITGHIALKQIKRTGERGKEFATIGLVLGYTGIAIMIILITAGVFILVQGSQGRELLLAETGSGGPFS